MEYIFDESSLTLVDLVEIAGDVCMCQHSPHLFLNYNLEKRIYFLLMFRSHKIKINKLYRRELIGLKVKLIPTGNLRPYPHFH